MSSLFRTVAALAEILWTFIPDGFKTVWMTVPSGMRTVILTAGSMALVAAAFRIDRLWLRIVTGALAVILIVYIIAQSLNYLSR
jgi:hypothetical protein